MSHEMEEPKLSHRSRKRIKEVKKKARPGMLLIIVTWPSVIFNDLN